MKRPHLWTKAEVKKLAKLWDESSIEDLSKELNLEPKQIKYMVARMRLAGFKLAKKRKVAYIDSLLKEVLAETKKKK